MANIVLVLAVVLTAACLVLCLTAVAIPYWLYTDDPNLDYQGLWVRCREKNSVHDCRLLKLAPEFVDATRVMMLFGACMYTFALLFGTCYTCCRREKSSYMKAAMVFSLLGALFCMIGVIVYGAKYTYLLGSEYASLHAGFGIGVVSGLGGFVCSFFFCVSLSREY